MNGLRSAERTIRGRVARRNRSKGESGNMERDKKGKDDVIACEDECLFEMFLATLHDE